jgi:hypothetical protein
MSKLKNPAQSLLAKTQAKQSRPHPLSREALQEAIAQVSLSRLYSHLIRRAGRRVVRDLLKLRLNSNRLK